MKKKLLWDFEIYVYGVYIMYTDIQYTLYPSLFCVAGFIFLWMGRSTC